ncbi:uncharacterized protein ISCGN_010107 [Ixodes scapularis]
MSQWLLAMGRLNMKPKVHHKICSKHFVKSCFFAGMDRPCLRPDAIPTLFNRAQAKTKLSVRKLPQISRARSSPDRGEKPNGTTATNETQEGSFAIGCHSVLKSAVGTRRKSATSSKACPKGCALLGGTEAQRNVTANEELPASAKPPTQSKIVDTKVATKTRMDLKKFLCLNTTKGQSVTVPVRKITVRCELPVNDELAACNISTVPKQLPVMNVKNEGAATGNIDLDNSVLGDRSKRSLLRKKEAEVSDCMPLKKRPLQDTLQGTVAPQESPETDSGMPCSDEASLASASLSGVVQESNGTVNRLLDSGSSQFPTTAAEALFLHTYCGDETTSPHLSKVARELQEAKQKLYAADRRLRRRDQTIRQQRTTIDELERQVSLLKSLEGFRVSNCLPTDLIRDWHENASRVSYGHRYRPMTLEFASGLHACSPRAYRFVGKWLPMPSMQLVRKHGVETAVPGVFCASSENLESFDEGCETRVSETQQALAALGASVTAGSVVDVEVVGRDDVLLSH